jgi:hypothetical protein
MWSFVCWTLLLPILTFILPPWLCQWLYGDQANLMSTPLSPDGIVMPTAFPSPCLIFHTFTPLCLAATCLFLILIRLLSIKSFLVFKVQQPLFPRFLSSMYTYIYLSCENRNCAAISYSRASPCRVSLFALAPLYFKIYI